jgi:ankyrin repeat protein
MDDALRYSAGNGHLYIVQYLVEHGADIHADNDCALRLSAANGHLETVKYLVEHGADIHAEMDYSLCWGAKNGHLETVKYLVENGADIHAKTNYAIRLSAKNGHIEVVNYLIMDCNMVIDKDTIEYLKENNLSEIINIVKSRDLYININNKLDNSYNYKTRLKI